MSHDNVNASIGDGSSARNVENHDLEPTASIGDGTGIGNVGSPDSESTTAWLFGNVTLEDGTELIVTTDSSGEVVEVPSERVGSLVGTGSATDSQGESHLACRAFQVLDESGAIMPDVCAVSYSDRERYFQATTAHGTD